MQFRRKQLAVQKLIVAWYTPDAQKPETRKLILGLHLSMFGKMSTRYGLGKDPMYDST